LDDLAVGTDGIAKVSRHRVPTGTTGDPVGIAPVAHNRDRVVTGSSIDGVVARPRRENVVPSVADQLIVAAEAVDPVIALGSPENVAACRAFENAPQDRLRRVHADRERDGCADEQDGDTRCAGSSHLVPTVLARL